MLDAKKILDQFLGAGSGSGPSRGGGLGGAVGDALAKIGGPQTPARPGQPSQPSAGGGGVGDILGGLTKGGLGGVAGGALAGTLASVLLGGKGGKTVKKLGGSAVQLGGLAILGGLAYKAWQNYQQKQAPQPGAPYPYPQVEHHAPQAQNAPVEVTPPPSSTPFTPSSQAEEQQLGLLLIRAMIAAARADGKIDREEIAKIREALKAAGSEDDEENFLLEHLGQPDDLDAIAAEAQGPELASEVWLAARLTIEPDTSGERYFLETLASKLKLDRELVAHLEATAAQAKQGGVTTG
ncbi:DUF533 domain-containing protein [Methylopila henanensis]|uniref:DUF533 domain-containing protein n=1 Tax=Methylopila henanensis TaxID=873516 RepID=A0ABW4K9U5_9HYPH